MEQCKAEPHAFRTIVENEVLLRKASEARVNRRHATVLPDRAAAT